MRRTSYQRGFTAGELLMVQWIVGRLERADEARAPELEHAIAAMGPVAAVAGLVGKGIGGQDIEPHDYDEWAEEELRDERRRIEFSIEQAMYFGTAGRGVDEDQGDQGEGRAFERVPEHLREGLRFYLDEHVQPGQFLTAVLMNDLAEAFARADLNSRVGLFDLVSYLHNYAPAPAWRGKQQVKLWLTPAIPQLEVRRLGPALTLVEGNKTACPCGGFHLAHETTAPFGRVSIPDDGQMKAEHQVQFVYCHQVQLHVVGVEGREFE